MQQKNGDRKGDNDVYGLYFQSGRNMCAGDTDAERNDDAVGVIVVNERNPSLGLGFAKTQKFGFLPKLFFNQNPNRNPSF